MANLAQLLGTRGPAAADVPMIDAAARDWDADIRVTEALNDGVASAWSRDYIENMPRRVAPRAALAVGTDLKQWNYRYMFEKKGERSLELDNRLDQMGEVIAHAFSLDELSDPSIPSQESVYTVGRICSRVDPGVAQSRLSPQTLMLESSRMVGNGQRVALALDPECRVRYAWSDESAGASSTVGLFPGMIVGLRGRNGSGGRFVADEILMPPALPHPATSRTELQEQYSAQDGVLRFAIACGPFTAPTDLDFRPWHRLMDFVEHARPDVVVLLGPFLSESHPLIEKGDIDELPTDIFRRHISQRLVKLVESSPSTLPVLVPSTSDVFHAHHAYPQPFIDKSDPALGLPKRTRCLPNPCVFYINELAIGVSTADVLGDLQREELVQRVAAAPDGTRRGADPMVRLARHVLGQRNFYPLFPPSATSGLPLDLSHSALCALQQVTPDLLILPSRVRPFLRVVDSAVVVNPGQLASENGDSFVRTQVEPFGSLDGEPEDLVVHELYRRARVELVHTTT
ncbi:DNA-directed DNA polymerase alpha subunit pol12 [Malassezia cuniculi]|uniref:DNA polymerase alpha subunit B n=1 Tax=Malassezia cuniculi TaxID=948313 RepID=A0AAF0ERA0_9BASI|nr:DNA-directed DNA polymerase alpha subunit pol12 [Malassezia cuniculi]